MGVAMYILRDRGYWPHAGPHKQTLLLIQSSRTTVTITYLHPRAGHNSGWVRNDLAFFFGMTSHINLYLTVTASVLLSSPT